MAPISYQWDEIYGNSRLFVAVIAELYEDLLVQLFADDYGTAKSKAKEIEGVRWACQNNWPDKHAFTVDDFSDGSPFAGQLKYLAGALTETNYGKAKRHAARISQILPATVSEFVGRNATPSDPLHASTGKLVLLRRRSVGDVDPRV